MLNADPQPNVSEDLPIKNEFLAFCDQFSEFNDYCAFFCKSVSLHINEADIELDDNVARGAERYAQLLTERSYYFNRWIQQLVKKI